MAWPTTSRQSRGYGAAHDRMRRHLIQTVGVCQECERQGRVEVGTIADHIVPLSKGGTHERRNYQLLCQACSDAKGVRDKGHKSKATLEIDDDGWPIDPQRVWGVSVSVRQAGEKPGGPRPTPRSKV